MKPIAAERRGPVLIVRFARPEQRNALDWECLSEIQRLLDRAENEADVRAVVVTGTGDVAFSAGADIRAIGRDLADPETALREFVQRGQQLTLRIEHFAKPVIAAVNGLAYGGGCEIVEACHLAVAVESATFGKPEIRLGFPPTWGGTQRLPRLVGRKRALAMILTAEPISATEARGAGLINDVVPDGTALEHAVDWVSRISVHSPTSVAACLTAVSRGAELGIEAALAMEASQFMRVAGTQAVRDGVERFLTGRRGAKP